MFAAFSTLSGCNQTGFTASDNTGQAQLEMDNSHPDLPTTTTPTSGDPAGTPGTGDTPNTPAPAVTPAPVPEVTPGVTPPPAPVPAVTPPPAPVPAVTPGATPPPAPGDTMTPPPPAPGKSGSNPKPTASTCPKKTDNSIPPAIIDSLVMKYGCVDSSDEGKDSNDKKIQICHIPKGNPKAAHALCIAVQGAVNGHGIDLKTCKSPVGDYCGACKPE
jgi:hypothetical protein